MTWPAVAPGPHSNATTNVAQRPRYRSLAEAPPDHLIQVAAGNLHELIGHERLLFDLVDILQEVLDEARRRQ